MGQLPKRRAYTWKVPGSLTTVTCPRCYTRQPAAYPNDQTPASLVRGLYD